MKLIFFGDCMFGRNNNKFILNPFKYVEHIIKTGDFIFFNLETTVSNPPLSDKFKEDKVFNYQSNGSQLLSLRKLTKKPIFVSSVNNHSLDYGVQGYQNTIDFLKSNNFLCNPKKRVEYKNIVFLNASDHCGCNNKKKWEKHILMIDYNNLDSIYQRIKNIKNNDNNAFIIFSIHWGSNWVKNEFPQKYINFGKKLIDYGVSIVFGHSAHHIIKNPIIEYNNGIIICGLGDFINDYAIKKNFDSNKALICIINKTNKKLTYETIKVKRTFVEEGGSIPIIKKVQFI